MQTTPDQAPATRGRYFEELEVGDVFVSPCRTITRADIVNFACMSGDFNAPHVDDEFCRQQPYGEVLAHGWMIFGIAAGLTFQTGFQHGRVVAMLGLDRWDIHHPVKSGDTLHVRITIQAKRPTSKPGFGVIHFEREVINQRGEVVQSMLVPNLFLRKPAQTAATA
ncbi:MaoC/PaaZ C-terminal domain-containing protein [Hydrogenophaga sp.]|uniref:MaoC/PaaZ C-terminal domain-containing protein n=1 Tax=Hydrogenophaga sp. TaxID=1904254 RepID=UPI00260F82D5|nr:MaoC/PaaZ C-terminal domain-containing protein [Hydrogenophaga sp.]MCW5653178.1 MaoC family dehydratase N-terminal domain-containing protein [Hydrogenophaga sp.]